MILIITASTGVAGLPQNQNEYNFIDCFFYQYVCKQTFRADVQPSTINLILSNEQDKNMVNGIEKLQRSREQ